MLTAVRRPLAPLAAAMVAALALLLGGMPADAAAAPPPRSGDVIAGQFIVTLAEGVDAEEVAREYRRRGAQIQHVYGAALNGFAGRMSDPVLRQARRDGRIVRVEPDGVVTTTATQTGATWGLDRIDQRERPLDQVYTYGSTGAGVTAYVIDTGIRATHGELAGRVAGGHTSIDDGRGTDDCNGHGTHVAGTIGGSVYGVAKAVALVPVRVLDCSGSGTWSGVIAGVDWVTGHATGPAVANMSLGGGGNTSVDDAVKRSIAAGVTYAVAAGNSGKDACRYSPARVPEALTVGATTSADARAGYSNFGGCLDLFAPGSSITSAWHTSDTAANTISGTSMASPHVAGVAALHLEGNGSADPSAVGKALIDGATPGQVTSAGTGSPDLLLYSLLAATPEEEPVDAPLDEPPAETAPALSASFTTTCSGSTCTFTSTSTGAISSTSWSFGDGSTATGTPVDHRYGGIGSYHVILEVADGDATAQATGTVSCTRNGKSKNFSCTGG